MSCSSFPFLILVAPAGTNPYRVRLQTPVLEIREAKRLRKQEEEKKKVDAKVTALRKRWRREGHEKENRRREWEGLSLETTSESTPDASSSSGRVDFSESEDFKAVTAGNPPPVQQRASVEASVSAASEKRLAPVTIETTLVPGADKRSPIVDAP